MRLTILFCLAALAVLASPGNSLLSASYEEIMEQMKKQYEDAVKSQDKMQEERNKKRRERLEYSRCDGLRQAIEAKTAMGRSPNIVDYLALASCLPPGQEKNIAQNIAGILAEAKWIVCTNQSVFSCTRCLLPKPLLKDRQLDSVCPGTYKIFDTDAMADNWVGLNCCK